ncbi:TetR/AcrR family transcriptional regulator [Lapidilactobacillus wuchangensis]|uniref:TetR/AcrR family transcriptional regulator n=1 Tax=Lapidilactobacillus wuchangensis TaxID=2486001 RepID=UPI000F7BA1DE|nr:TetR/AcrR family transcriptional regulator [Lapidilactobacillus wuchangensis]
MTKRLPEDPQKKARMLAAAIQLFAAQGYEVTHVDQIAQQAAVSKGLVFKYFVNKEQLYLAALTAANQQFMTVIDRTVWQDSPDLSAMVINATRYKIQLQLQFPAEFKLLMTAFVHQQQLPASSQAYVQKMFVANHDLTSELMAPVVARLKFKPGVTAADFLEVIGYITNGYVQKIQQYLAAHPEMTRIEQMEPLIQDLATKLRLVESGFVVGG